MVAMGDVVEIKVRDGGPYKVTGPIRPMYISATMTRWAAGGRSAVTPVDRPTVPGGSWAYSFS